MSKSSSFYHKKICIAFKPQLVKKNFLEFIGMYFKNIFFCNQKYTKLQKKKKIVPIMILFN